MVIIMISPNEAQYIGPDVDRDEYVQMTIDINWSLSRKIWSDGCGPLFFLTADMFKQSTVNKVINDLRELGWEIDDRTDSNEYRGFYVQNPFRKPQAKKNPWWVRWFRAIT